MTQVTSKFAWFLVFCKWFVAMAILTAMYPHYQWATPSYLGTTQHVVRSCK